MRALLGGFGRQDGFYGTPDNIFGIKMCLRIQESCLGTLSSVLDHHRGDISSHEVEKVHIFAYSSKLKTSKNIDFFDFF